MAGTLSLTWQAVVANGEDNENKSHQDSIVQTNIGKQVVQVATSTVAAALTIPSMTARGIGWIENLSSVDGENIDIGPQSDGGTIEDFLRLKPGEKFPMRFKHGVTIWHQADTGTPILRVTLLED